MVNQDIIGTLLGERYRIQRLIARGGMASVYLAIDERLEREVAIKVIYQHLAEDEGFRAKFLREAKMAAKLSHPNIVNIFDQGEDSDLIFLAMEYVPSITLRDAIKQFGAIPVARALELFEFILQGLGAAHQKNILHRDIKPENVFLADDGRIKLGDFGLAREANSHTSTGSLVGTIAYLSPELITRGKADARSDVYAAGIMLFEMLTGEQPFQGTEAAYIAHQHTTATMPLPSSKNPAIPALVDELVLWATARQREFRPNDANELLEITRRVAKEIASGKANTAKIEVLEQAKTRIYDFSPDETAQLDGMRSESDEATQIFDEYQPLENATTIFDHRATADISQLQTLVKRRRTRAKVLWLLIPLLALASGLAGFILNGGIGTIPNLQNRSVDQALASLAGYSDSIIQREVNDKDIPVGKVIGTEPATGVLIWRGTQITLLVSKGPKMLNVPALNGLTQQAAEAALNGAGFTLGTVYQSFSPVTKDQVYKYTGDDNAKLPEGSAVDLEVSLGALPDFAGQRSAQVEQKLNDLQLTVAQVQKEYSETIAKDAVIRVEPVQNPLRLGGEVTLVVSKGSTAVVMPKVIGETLSAAKNLLESLGLKVLVNTDQLTANWGIVKVKSVSAPEGSTVHLGDQITISNK